MPTQQAVRLAVIAVALFANAFAMANPFAYAPFLVLHFDLADDKRSVGFFAGFIISSFMLGRIVGSFPLGVLSDMYGRRPVIELGLLLSCGLFQLGFALSPTFAIALSFRFLMGASNGIIGVAKAWLPELAPPAQQAFAMSMGIIAIVSNAAICSLPRPHVLLVSRSDSLGHVGRGPGHRPGCGRAALREPIERPTADLSACAHQHARRCHRPCRPVRHATIPAA